MALPSYAETYLTKVRQALASLPKDERDDIVNELTSHLVERQAQGKTDLLDGFDAPDQYAAEFASHKAMRGALAAGTPWALVRALFIGARNHVFMLCALAPLMLLQLAGVSTLACVLLKPFMPSLGLWVGGEHGFLLGEPDAGGVGVSHMHQLDGWWIFPLIGIAALLMLWQVHRAMMALLRWRLQQSGPLARARTAPDPR